MRKTTLTCPFTGLCFDAIETADKDVIFTNPLSGEQMKLTYNNSCKRYMIDAETFKKIDMLDCGEAADILGITRQRVSKIAADGIIPNVRIANKLFFKRSDVLHYKETRKVGAPRKEGNDA